MAKLPAGATNLHKNMASGSGLKEAESKALGKAETKSKPSKR
jgi:hypothetical protein